MTPVYVVEIPASAATSSLRGPGVRRRAPVGGPTSPGRNRPRRERNGSASSCRKLTFRSLDTAIFSEGRPA
ncbi:MAG: hypothetical protein JO100_08205 [Pseudonocardia sp.]|nr:hypothetical protein [Pseudonocardia sp.]